MEIKSCRRFLQNQGKLFSCFCLLFFIVVTGVYAQPPADLNTVNSQPPVMHYTVKDGKMFIQLSKHLPVASIDSFIRQFNLSGLGLKNFIAGNNADSILKSGWQMEINSKDEFAISKSLLSSDDINNVGEPLVLSIADRFPPQKSGLIFGYNEFKKQNEFKVEDSLVTFINRNNRQARQVMLSGSFNEFSTTALPMHKTDSGWVATIKLSPGKYWYKFIADGKWLIDENNQCQENDMEGNTNSVYFKTNTLFHLNGYQDSKRIYLAGSFNNWQPGKLAMQRTATGWVLPLYLAEGTYTYRFIADGEWFEDPANSNKLPNEFNEFNSVLQIGKPYLFRLNGFAEAKKVLLTGSFNFWRRDELFMKKTGSGWELPYTIGAGNYEYRFIVDGAEMADPANPVLSNPERDKANSILILEPNYTFRLKGYGTAKTVILAGDFNQFNTDAFVMKKEAGEWLFTLHLSPGKHLYKFIIDGNWITDPQNKLWEQNEFGTNNSVLWIEP